jgi:type IV pilus assembly protein PilM
MAEQQSTVALNIGSQRIGMAVFETSKNGGLVIKAYGTESIVADPAMEAARISQTRVAIAELVKRLKIGKSKARYAISGQSAFIRFVKLPPLQEDNIEQLVTFEAQQHVPFPLAEVVWDYELIDGGAEKEAVIVAIKGDALDEINATVNDAGLETQEVDAAPMAIYNAFRATYGTPEEPVLLIDIGAKTSNLLYIEGKRFFTRSINIGGSSITAAVAKEYGVSFMEAEHQKVSNGLVALGGGHTEQMDEAVAALAMAIRNALSRLPAEIARTTNYYRSQHGGSAPRRVLLAGGGANLPYTLEFFQEKLNLPVEYFNPVRNVAIGKGVDHATIQRDGHMMGELVGLGLRGIGKSQINIDLVPLVVEQARTADRRKPYFVASAAAVLLGMGLWAMFQHLAAGAAKEEARLMNDQKESLAPFKTSIEGLLKKEGALRQIASQYTQAEADQVFWIDALAELSATFASDSAWLTDFEPIHGMDIAQLMDPKQTPGEKKIGKTIIRSDFATTPFGTSPMEKIQAAAPTGQKGRPQPAAAPPAETASAVRVKGLWRSNEKSQNLVVALLKSLNEKSSHFTFTLKDPANPKQSINLLDDQNLPKILTITSVAPKPGELALPFEIIIPLSRGVTIK